MEFTNADRVFLTGKMAALSEYLKLHATVNREKIDEVFCSSWDTLVTEFPKMVGGSSAETLTTKICVTLGIRGFQSLFWQTPSDQWTRIHSYLQGFMTAFSLTPKL